MEVKKIVSFDFDGTLTTKDTLFEFIKFSRGKFRLYFCLLLFSPLLLAFKLKLYPNWKIKQTIFRYLYKNISLDQFNKWGDSFIVNINQIIRPKAIQKLKEYQSEDAIILIVSASIENWIKPWANSEGINVILATTIEVNCDRILTGNFKSENCYREQKVNRILEVFPDRSSYTLIAYGDSLGDKEMIDFADEGWYNKFK